VVSWWKLFSITLVVLFVFNFSKYILSQNKITGFRKPKRNANTWHQRGKITAITCLLQRKRYVYSCFRPCWHGGIVPLFVCFRQIYSEGNKCFHKQKCAIPLRKQAKTFRRQVYLPFLASWSAFFPPILIIPLFQHWYWTNTSFFLV